MACVFARRRDAVLGVFLLLSPLANAAFTQSLPGPWAATDVGAPLLGGSATYSSGLFTVNAAGADIGGYADQFHFVYRPLTGDGEVTARVDSLTAVRALSKAGVMIRASLSADAAHAFTYVSASNGIHFRRRPKTGGSSVTATPSSEIHAPIWVRLVREADTVTSYWSAGTTWTLIRSDKIALGATAYVGIAVTSRAEGVRTTARLSSVALSKPALPLGQKNVDIGAPALPGDAGYAAGRYTIAAAGDDIGGTGDQFHFVYQPFTGDADVRARVVSLAHTSDWAKAGVMIRESLTRESRHATLVLSAGRGYSFRRREAPGGTTETSSGGSGAAPGWVRLVRKGDLFQAYRSADGKAWTRFATDTIPMGAAVFVGLAATSRNISIATTAVTEGFSISEDTTANLPPIVTISSPGNGAIFPTPATLTVAAVASDPEGRMASVDFYADGALLARDTTPPYSTPWAVSVSGTHSLTSVARDADGGVTSSAPVSIVVAEPGDVPRWIIFGASLDHDTMVASYLFEVFASGTDPSTALPITTLDLGKPTPDAADEITFEAETFFSSLAAGEYIATVSAIGPTGAKGRGEAMTFTR